MADSVTITETAGPQYTWATAAFTWGSASAGKSWNSAYPAVYGVAVAVALALAEARRAEPTKSVSEQFGLADSLARQVSLRRSETIAFAETYADLIAYVLRFVESLGFGEVLARANQKAFSESLNAADRLGIDATKRLAEEVSIADGLARSVDKQLAEELALADALRRDAGKHITEAFGLVDDVDRAIGKHIAETIGFSETYTDLIAFVLAISENLGFSEVLGKHTTRPLSESFQLADSATKSAVKNVSEALSMAEAFGRTVAYRRAINEGFALSDALSRAYGLRVNEALDLAEQYRRRANGVVSDMIVASTAISEQDFIDIMEAGQATGWQLRISASQRELSLAQTCWLLPAKSGQPEIFSEAVIRSPHRPRAVNRLSSSNDHSWPAPAFLSPPQPKPLGCDFRALANVGKKPIKSSTRKLLICLTPGGGPCGLRLVSGREGCREKWPEEREPGAEPP